LFSAARPPASSAATSGLICSCRTACRCSDPAPLISRSTAKISSMRRTASIASGTCLKSASTKNLRRPWPQHAAFSDRAGSSLGLVEIIEASIRIGLQGVSPAGRDAGAAARRLGRANRKTWQPRERCRRTVGHPGRRSTAARSLSCSSPAPAPSCRHRGSGRQPKHGGGSARRAVPAWRCMPYPVG
jgi:hypothetical protein